MYKKESISILQKHNFAIVLHTALCLTATACLPSTQAPTLHEPITTPSASSTPFQGDSILLPANAPPIFPSPTSITSPTNITNTVQTLRIEPDQLFLTQKGETQNLRVEAINANGERISVNELDLVWGTDRSDLVQINQNGTVQSLESQGAGFIFVSLLDGSHRTSISFIIQAKNTAPESNAKQGSNSSNPGSSTSIRHCSENSSCTITTFAGLGTAGDSGDFGAAENAELNEPHGLYINEERITYIADSFNHKVREVLPSGFISTLAGINFNGFNGEEGNLRDILLDFPNSITGHENLLYLSDKVNNRIRVINLEERTLTTIAGGGDTIANDIPATSARLSFPLGVALHEQRLYFADSLNHQIRAIDLTTQELTAVAGNFFFGNSGNGGPATAALLDTPHDIAFDTQGNLYIADTFNHQIRKVDTQTGVISVYAGTGSPGMSGNGGPAIQASLNTPTGLAFNSLGHLYIADSQNKVVRMVNRQTGIITTIAGGGDNTTNRATDYRFGLPYEVYVDLEDHIYVTDTVNNKILRIN